MMRTRPTARQALVAALVVAFALRVVASLVTSVRGPGGWPLGYEGFLAVAQSLVAGRGLCVEDTCAWFMPLYPLLLTAPAALSAPWLALLLQALVGTLTCLCAYALASRLFGALAGVLACGLCAVYPYYVVHDTALQDTSLHALCVALGVWALVHAAARGRARDFALAGLAFGAATLTRAAALPLLLLAGAWVALWGATGTARVRAQATAAFALAFALTVLPWVARNVQLTGSAVLSSQTGLQLFRGNNPQTFATYPARSMDASSEHAFLGLSAEDSRRLDACAETEVAISECLEAQALRYLRQHPIAALARVPRKLAAGFSPVLNPERSGFAQLVYALGYVPVLALGLLGLVLERRRREVKLFALVMLSFCAVTAVFYAHTSHRSHLDVYFIVLAAGLLARWVRPAGATPRPTP
jgi:4-amino-4-deoxy-L-arabinose transferase-like glycosyltransferase